MKPIPVQVLHWIVSIAHEAGALTKGTADLIILAFSFLLGPGEYNNSQSDTSPF